MATAHGSQYPSDREQRIAEAAYFRAEKRGFRGGDPVTDWVEAEREVDSQLRLAEHRRLLDDLESRVATTGAKLKSLKKRLSSKTAEARRELEEEIQKLARLRDALEVRVEEVRAQGLEASQKARAQAEKVWSEIAETINRLSSRKRKPRA